MKTKLQEARRSRGWSQAQLMDSIEDASERLGIELPARSSLKTMVSMFENGRRTPGPEYKTLFCEVYQQTRHQLGLSLETAPSQLDTLPSLPAPRMAVPTASPEIIGYLQSVFVQHAQAEPLVGPRFLAPAVQSQMPLIEQLCTEASGPDREAAVRVGARYAEFLGWLYQDTGNSQSAMEWTNRALEYASELGDPKLTSYVFQRRSNIAAEAGQAGYALGLANVAVKEAQQLPAQVHAVGLRALANAHALLGDRDNVMRTLEQAHGLADRAAPGESDLAPYCSPSYIDMEAAICSLYLSRPEEAVHALQDGLTQWPTEQERDRGLALARLASARALMEDVEGAHEAGAAAATIAQATGSARVLAELGRLRQHLRPWRKLVEIAELDRIVGSMGGELTRP